MEQTIYDAGVGVIIQECRDIQSYDKIVFVRYESSELGLVAYELESQFTWWDRSNAALNEIIATAIMFSQYCPEFHASERQVLALKECLGFYPFRSLCPCEGGELG